jgi:hypothetical protein
VADLVCRDLHDTVRLNAKRCDFGQLLLDFAGQTIWHLSCCFVGTAHLFSLLRDNWHEEKRLKND